MNIFLLHKDYKISAKLHPKKLLPKMLLEHTQMLCTAAKYHNPEIDYKWLYKPVHKKHPCNLWLRLSKDNYQEMLDRTYYMWEEYYRRNNKDHKSIVEHNRFTRLQELSQYLKFPDRPKTLYHTAFNPESGLRPYSYIEGWMGSDKQVYELYRLYILTKWYITLEEQIKVIEYVK